MPRRVNRIVDFDRTELLGIDELFVQKGKGDDDHFFTWQHEPDVDFCPYCGSVEYKTHNLFSREYTDAIQKNGIILLNVSN